MPEGNKVLARNIRQARRNMGITQQQAAELLGITQLHYGRLERGDRRTSLEQLEQIAEVFHVSPYTLLEGCFIERPRPTFQQSNISDTLKHFNALLVNCSPDDQALCYDICERITRGK